MYQVILEATAASTLTATQGLYVGLRCIRLRSPRKYHITPQGPPLLIVSGSSMSYMTLLPPNPARSLCLYVLQELKMSLCPCKKLLFTSDEIQHTTL